MKLILKGKGVTWTFFEKEPDKKSVADGLFPQIGNSSSFVSR